MATARKVPSRLYTRVLSVVVSPQQRADLQVLADRLMAPMSLIIRLAIQEKIARELHDGSETRRGAK